MYPLIVGYIKIALKTRGNAFSRKPEDQNVLFRFTVTFCADERKFLKPRCSELWSRSWTIPPRRSLHVPVIIPTYPIYFRRYIFMNEMQFSRRNSINANIVIEDVQSECSPISTLFINSPSYYGWSGQIVKTCGEFELVYLHGRMGFAKGWTHRIIYMQYSPFSDTTAMTAVVNKT